MYSFVLVKKKSFKINMSENILRIYSINLKTISRFNLKKKYVHKKTLNFVI